MSKTFFFFLSALLSFKNSKKEQNGEFRIGVETKKYEKKKNDRKKRMNKN